MDLPVLSEESSEVSDVEPRDAPVALVPLPDDAEVVGAPDLPDGLAALPDEPAVACAVVVPEVVPDPMEITRVARTGVFPACAELFVPI